MSDFSINLIEFSENNIQTDEDPEESNDNQLENNTNQDLTDEKTEDSNKRSAEESNDDNISDNKETDENQNKKVKKVIKESEIKKTNKRGIIYLSYIPLGLSVQKIRQLLSEFGEIDRIYLEKEKDVNEKVKKAKKKNQKKSYNCRYAEGWVEFKKKRVAKTVATVLNGKQIGGKRKNKFYDQIWSIKYLHKFKWSHLAEQLSYEKALRQQRLRLEIGRAKKETAFYEQMAHKFNYNKRKKLDENNSETNDKRNYKQRLTDEVIRKNKSNDNDIDFDLLSKIFK